MSKEQKKSNGFDKHFLWGASTASHQIEGGNHNQWSVWELENAKTKAAQAEYHFNEYPRWDAIKHDAKSPDNYVSGDLADHYNRYKEDFDYLTKMNMNAYRFSIEWSRVEPREGAWNAEAITHYKQYLVELRKRDIEPVVTLFHFTLPVWFSEMGGFEKRANVKYFVRFAEKIVHELGTNMRFIITINEPEVYAFESYYLQEWPPNQNSIWKYLRVLSNMALGHKRAAKVIHSMNRKFRVSIAKNSTYDYPGDSAWLSRLSANVIQYFQDDFVIKKFVKSCDFLGVNYYFTNRVYGYRIHNPDSKTSDLHWDLQPADIEFVIERLNKKYKLPIMITENGLADEQDQYRQWWIKETIIGMQKAIASGAEVIGYLHWSLMDNFEWAYGKWPRFGLVAVDYKTGKRTLRPSALWYAKVLKRLRGL